jgi:copper homeostasis protein
MGRKIEICANGHQSAISAELGGANRVELCAALPEGGTTPSYGEIRKSRESIKIPINVIIRPRGGDFLYSRSEVDAMLYDVQMCRDLGVNGVVVGALMPDGSVDCRTVEQLIRCAGGMDVTFHRAFDMCCDPVVAAREIINMGCKTILTSGQKSSALLGVGLIAELIERYGSEICFMPGCGVSLDNICEIERRTHAEWFHLSARCAIQSKMVYRNTNVSMGGTVNIDEYCNDVSSVEIIKEILCRKE